MKLVNALCSYAIGFVFWCFYFAMLGSEQFKEWWRK